MKTTPILSLLVSAIITLPLTAYSEDKPIGTQQLAAQAITTKNATDYVRFMRSSVEPVIEQGGFLDQLKAKISALGNYQNLVIEVVGHSDNEKMSPATKAKFGSNTNLSYLRAQRAMELIKQSLDLDNVKYRVLAMGPTKPLRPNSNAANRAFNRRGEINLYYDLLAGEAASSSAAPVAISTPETISVDTPVAISTAETISVATPVALNTNFSTTTAIDATSAATAASAAVDAATAIATSEAVNSEVAVQPVAEPNQAAAAVQPVEEVSQATAAVQPVEAANQNTELAQPESSQSSTALQSPASTASSDSDVKAALSVKADDEDGNSLKEALTAVDKNYSLIKRGEIGFSYSYGFTYSSTESLELSDNPDEDSGKRYVTNVSRDSRYTHRSNIAASYGLLNNITVGASVPVVTAHRDRGSTSNAVDDTNVGDVGIDIRWQPWETRLGKINTTIGASASLPTGTSPYKIDSENSISTGSGTYGFGLSASFSKIIDPVIAYGGISVSHSLPIENLSQKQGSQVLVKVEPQPSISYSLGLGYALSYGVSLNIGFSHSFAAKTKLYYSDDVVTLAKGDLLEQELIGGHSAMANASVGFRVSPGTVLSMNLGIGLTRESPDFTVGLSLPFSFGGVKERVDQ